MGRIDPRVRLALLCVVVPALAACGGGGDQVDSGQNPPGTGAPLVSMAGIDCG